MAVGARARERGLRKDRVAVLLGLGGITALAWAYTVRAAADMGGGMHGAYPWGAGETVLMSVMWVAMMIAMMVPSAAPMVLMFSTIQRRRGERGDPPVPTAVFASAYVVVWAAFGLLATLVNWVLHQEGLLISMAGRSLPLLGGALLIVAGAYQMSPLKEACLVRCRSPLAFLMGEWRRGWRGAFVVGTKHGLYCLGCCWALMALLFALGVMNLLWIATLGAVVLAEKTLPRGVWLGRALGVALVGWGAWMVAASVA